MKKIFDEFEADIVLFFMTLFEERKDLEKMIISLRKEVNERDLLLKKYTGNTYSHITYMDLLSDTLASHYDNPIYKRYEEFLKGLI